MPEFTEFVSDEPEPRDPWAERLSDFRGLINTFYMGFTTELVIGMCASGDACANCESWTWRWASMCKVLIGSAPTGEAYCEDCWLKFVKEQLEALNTRSQDPAHESDAELFRQLAEEKDAINAYDMHMATRGDGGGGYGRLRHVAGKKRPGAKKQGMWPAPPMEPPTKKNKWIV